MNDEKYVPCWEATFCSCCKLYRSFLMNADMVVFAKVWSISCYTPPFLTISLRLPASWNHQHVYIIWVWEIFRFTRSYPSSVLQKQLGASPASSNRISHHQRNISSTYVWHGKCGLSHAWGWQEDVVVVFFLVRDQLMISCWFGLVIWIPGMPLWKGMFFKGTLRIPDHQPKPPTHH